MAGGHGGNWPSMTFNGYYDYAGEIGPTGRTYSVEDLVGKIKALLKEQQIAIANEGCRREIAGAGAFADEPSQD